MVGGSRWDSRTIGGDSEPVWERSTALLKLRIPSRSLGVSRVGVVGQQRLRSNDKGMTEKGEPKERRLGLLCDAEGEIGEEVEGYFNGSTGGAWLRVLW